MRTDGRHRGPRDPRPSHPLTVQRRMQAAREAREAAASATDNAPRSSQPDVRNPVLDLPGIAELRALPVECREPLRQTLMAIRADAQVKAQESWRRNKGPMAAYWKAVGVYAGHIARAIR